MVKQEDGRTARRGRNSAAVLDTVHEMFVEGNFSPSVEDVAARSGVSLRSVYRYFEDTEALLHLAIERRIAVVGELYALDALGEGTQEARVLALVNQRLVLHSKLAPTIRAALLRAPFSPQIAEQVRQRRDVLAGQVAAQFAQETAALSGSRREELLAWIDALCSFDTMEDLRVRRGLSLSRARRVMVGGVTALLSSVPNK
ncbi:TetR/AcrR family transcriptional regulator [Nocardioides sp. URHA0020]|uniref:TetR/AcrR family transcriptional regulator n=1 Tax=Nocardioides sp. URHA0020 TaxID=1380392 RepID=UPI00048A5BE0|nr:TetR/AcrR family transcriptional regulator [Nocardioides sp. URHA0020]